MLDTCAGQAWLITSIRIVNLIQMVVQGRWLNDSTLLVLPHVDSSILPKLQMLKGTHIRCLPELIDYVDKNGKNDIYDALKDDLGTPGIDQVSCPNTHLQKSNMLIIYRFVMPYLRIQKLM